MVSVKMVNAKVEKQYVMIMIHVLLILALMELVSSHHLLSLTVSHVTMVITVPLEMSVSTILISFFPNVLVTQWSVMMETFVLTIFVTLLMVFAITNLLLLPHHVTIITHVPLLMSALKVFVTVLLKFAPPLKLVKQPNAMK